jgi:hypothetical protein
VSRVEYSRVGCKTKEQRRESVMISYKNTNQFDNLETETKTNVQLPFQSLAITLVSIKQVSGKYVKKESK